jgi:hypothetical protein
METKNSGNLEDILKVLDKKPSSALEKSYWFNMTPEQMEYYKRAEIIYDRIPSCVYTLERIAEVGEALNGKDKETDPKMFEEYKGVIDRFNSSVKEIEFTLRHLRKDEQKKPGANKEKIDEFERALRLMNAYHDTAVTLASYLTEEETMFNSAIESETKRNRGKITHIEEDKNLAVNSIKQGKSAVSKLLDAVVRVGPTIVAAASAYNAPGEVYIKGFFAIAAAMITYLPIDVALNYMEDKRVHTATHSQDENFQKEDIVHIKVKNFFENDHDATRAEICRRAVAKLAFETERYFNEAVVHTAKEIATTEAIDNETKNVLSDLVVITDPKVGP